MRREGGISPPEPMHAVLLSRLVEMASRWQVRLDDRTPLTSLSGVVAFGVRDTQPVVLKLVTRTSDEWQSAAALRHFSRTGAAVQVLESDDHGALLLRRILPGTSLAPLVLAGGDDEATRCLCQSALRLHGAGMPPTADAPFPTVEDWARAFARYQASGDGRLPAPLVARGAGLYHDLCADGSCRCLLHADLQHFNLLQDGEHGWLAIDPKGVTGEPAWEFGALLRNPHPQMRWVQPAVVDRRLGIIAEATGIERERILGWGFAQAVLSAVWSWEDGEEVAPDLAVAEALGAQLKVR